MAVCPNGHDSASDDFCDTCGMRIGGSPPPGSPQPGSPATGPSPASGAPPSAWPDPAASATAAEPCPRCGTPRNGQFCEACGYNFAGPRFTPTTASAPPPPAPRAYSSSQPGPSTGSYSSSQPGPGSGGSVRPQRSPRLLGSGSRPAQPSPAAPPAAVDVLVSVPAGHLDRGGGCGPRLLRAGAGGHRTGGLGRRFPFLLRRTPFPARRATRCGSGGGAYRAAWPRRST